MNITKEEYDNVYETMLEMEEDAVKKAKIYVKEFWKEIISIDDNELDESNLLGYVIYTPSISCENIGKGGYEILVNLEYNWTYDYPSEIYVPNYLTEEKDNGNFSFVLLNFDTLKMTIDEFRKMVRNIHMINKLIDGGV